MKKLIVVSGGQTGVDQAAFDAALKLGIQIQGIAPHGYACKSGTIPDRYLRYMTACSGGYSQRTKRNVESSDLTVVLTMGISSPGTNLTIKLCKQLEKDHVVVRDAANDFVAARLIHSCLHENSMAPIVFVNFAGPGADRLVDCHKLAQARIETILKTALSL